MDTEQAYEGQCEDVHGNKYPEGFAKTSCCECLMLVYLVIRLLMLRNCTTFYFSYTCNMFETYLMWNTSVSDRCCHHCDGVVYKADSVIDTVQHDDECQTVETLVCRILTGMPSILFLLCGSVEV